MVIKEIQVIKATQVIKEIQAQKEIQVIKEIQAQKEILVLQDQLVLIQLHQIIGHLQVILIVMIVQNFLFQRVLIVARVGYVLQMQFMDHVNFHLK